MFHWNRKAYRRNLAIQITLLLGFVFGISILYERNRKPDAGAQTLAVISKRILPLREISGLALMPGGQELAVIGDHSADLMLQPLAAIGEARKISFRKQLIDRFSLCQSEDFEECSKSIKKLTRNWEALAVAGDGRFYALQEHSQSILVFDPTFQSIETVLHFNFAEAFQEAISKGTKKNRKNSLGEGLVLLKNGHILVAKEGYPVSLVEFGPDNPEEKALGFSSMTLLDPTEAFSTPVPRLAHVHLKALHSWIIAPHQKCDLSEIAVSAQQELMMLSEKCKTISLVSSLSPNQPVKVSRTYTLPREITHPEALAALGADWYVASDVESTKRHNFYILRP